MTESDRKIERAHSRIDKVNAEFGEHKTEIAVSLAEINGELRQMNNLRTIEIAGLKKDLNDHLESHKKAQEKGWQVAMKFLSPAAIVAALWAIVEYFKGQAGHQ